jgi:hypothetical protein
MSGTIAIGGRIGDSAKKHKAEKPKPLRPRIKPAAITTKNK